MKTALMLIKRNIKLFFKDKGMFFTALITPAILLVLYATFLGNVYRDSFVSNLPPMLKLSEKRYTLPSLVTSAKNVSPAKQPSSSRITRHLEAKSGFVPTTSPWQEPEGYMASS